MALFTVGSILGTPPVRSLEGGYLDSLPPCCAHAAPIKEFKSLHGWPLSDLGHVCVSTVHELSHQGPFELHSYSECQPDISFGLSAEFPGPFDCFLSAKYIFELWVGSLKTPGCEQVEESGGLTVVSFKSVSSGKKCCVLTRKNSDSSEDLLHSPLQAA